MTDIPEWAINTGLAGFGAVAFASIKREKYFCWATAVSVAVGMGTAVSLAPWLCEYREWTSPASVHGVHFLVGLLGNPLCKYALALPIAKLIAIFAKEPPNGNGSGHHRRPRPDSDAQAS